MVYLDFDDFCEENHKLPLLRQLKAEIPNLKLTLFTIPGRCSAAWADSVQHLYGDWINLVPHGWHHLTSRECQYWDRERCEYYLDWIEAEFPDWSPGFKAPGWQISDAMYTALLGRGRWVADQIYNRPRRPAGLRVYEICSPDRVHGHIGHLGGHNPNELELIWSEVLAHREEEFGFINDLMLESPCQNTTSSSPIMVSGD